jgi:hypothetical protein
VLIGAVARKLESLHIIASQTCRPLERPGGTLTDASPRERSLTSSCGNVTVTIAPGAPPKVELADDARSLFAHDLAELVTATAKAAADAARDDAPEADAGPSIGDGLEHLTRLRDGLRDQGFAAVLEEQRARLEPEEGERRPPQAEQPARGPKLAMHPDVMAYLDSTVQMLQRFAATPPGTGKGESDDLPVGRAKHESRLVTIEATMEYPIASVVLSKRATEIGPRALSQQLTETAAAAAADLAVRQHGFLNGLGLPVGPDEASEVVGNGERLGAEGVESVTALRHQQEQLTRQFYEGGHFA